LRQEQRRLARDFPAARFGHVETATELETVFDALVRWHQARWTARGYRGTFPTATVIAFHRAIAREALARGCLRLYFLQIGDALVATTYCIRAGSRVLMYRTSFDESWAKYSVGTLLITYALQQSMAEAAKEFDFGNSQDAYKAHWATEVRESWRARAASPHLRGQLAWMRMQTADHLIAWAVKHIPRTARSKVRHLLRLA
jgi:CelD/BcsL family acetyltransferase involved in cellulose biosynthesis